MNNLMICSLHEGRNFDPETDEWVYVVFCSTHKNCSSGYEMFRKKRLNKEGQ